MLARSICHGYARPMVLVVSSRRTISTLPNNHHIKVFPNTQSLHPSHTLSYLPTDPPHRKLMIGTTNEIPPTPDSLRENLSFLNILQSVLASHAHQDPNTISQAQALASTSGATLGSGGAFFSTQNNRRRSGPISGGGGGTGGGGAGGASAQGGHGGAGRGGYIHVYDQRHPPDFGRIPEPEDIFGSLEVDGEGNFVDGHGRYQSSGSYRIVTIDGILGLSDFLRRKLIERLKVEETAIRE